MILLKDVEDVDVGNIRLHGRYVNISMTDEDGPEFIYLTKEEVIKLYKNLIKHTGMENV